MSEPESRSSGWAEVARATHAPANEADLRIAMAHRYSLMPHILDFADFPRWVGARVLEIGCGAGLDGVSFAQAGAEYTGLDISRAAWTAARQAFGWMKVDGNLVHADAAHLMQNVRQASFDLIYCFDALHEMNDPEEVIRQARRAIRPTGEFRLMLPARNSWAVAVGDGDGGFSKTQARTLLRANDYAAMSITQDYIVPYEPGSLEQRLPWFAAMTPAMFRKLEQSFGRHLLIRAQPS